MSQDFLKGEKVMGSRVRSALVALMTAALFGTLTAMPAHAASAFSGVANPTVSGAATVGKKLTAKRDTTTSPKATKVTYQWLRNGVSIAGAKSATYTPKSSDKGKRIAVKVCYGKPGYTTKCVTSAKTATVKAAAAAAGSCKIKGNISSSGEKIYHVPGQRFYNVTKINQPGERWFCSESAARSAGWRKSKV